MVFRVAAAARTPPAQRATAVPGPESGLPVATRRSSRHRDRQRDSGAKHQEQEGEPQAQAPQAKAETRPPPRGANLKEAASISASSASSASYPDSASGSDVESASEDEQTRDTTCTTQPESGKLKVAVDTVVTASVAGMRNSSGVTAAERNPRLSRLKLETQHHGKSSHAADAVDRKSLTVAHSSRSPESTDGGKTLETGSPSGSGGSTQAVQTSRRALQTIGTGRPSAQAVQTSRRAPGKLIRSNWTGLLENPRFIAVLVRVAAEKQVIPWAKSTNAVGYWLGAPVKTESFAGEAAKYNNTLLVRWRILREHATPALRQEFADYSVQENDTFPNATLLKEKCSVAMEQYANFFAAHIADPTNAEKRRRLQQHFLYSQCGPAAEFVARDILATDACRIGNATRQQTSAEVAVARTMLQNARVAPSHRDAQPAPTVATTTSHSSSRTAAASTASSLVSNLKEGAIVLQEVPAAAASVRTVVTVTPPAGRTRSGAQRGQQAPGSSIKDSALGKRRRSTRNTTVRSTRTKTSSVRASGGQLEDDAHQQQQALRDDSTLTNNLNSNPSTSSTSAASADSSTSGSATPSRSSSCTAAASLTSAAAASAVSASSSPCEPPPNNRCSLRLHNPRCHRRTCREPSARAMADWGLPSASRGTVAREGGRSSRDGRVPWSPASPCEQIRGYVEGCGGGLGA